MLFLVACGGSAEPTYAPEAVSEGKEFFASTYSACHGPDAKGLPNLGKDLTTSEYVRDSSDDELLSLLKGGRPSGHELNTTGVDMPPKGGNPSYTDEDLTAIVAFIRSINE
jgi:disulfide bond formation protein DsbB